MRYLSICSGIEAATVAWHPLGWAPTAFSEIEAFPRAVLSHHYPDVPLHGDFTTIKGDEYGPIDLLVGGTPCQSFSVAGLRGGLADDRGNLALQFLRLAQRTRPRWLVWENVPGVLSSNGGRDFGSILGGMVELGYGIAYRVLDAQFFGVPQRRRRVFVVGHLGDWRRAGAVLFERQSLSGNNPPSREKGQAVAACLGAGAAASGQSPNVGNGQGNIVEVAPTVTSKWAKGSGGPSGDECGNLISENRVFPTIDRMMEAKFGSNQWVDSGQFVLETSPTLCARTKGGGGMGSDFDSDGGCVAFTASEQANSYAWERGVYPTLNAQIPNDSSNIQQGVRLGSAVRRLTPRECERLQGFPDNYTLIPYRGKPAADGPRYKALGNSMAVPVMRWIGERIDMVEAICAQARAA